MTIRYGNLPYREAIEFFRQKLNLPTTAWDDIFRSQHDHAFVVAGASKVSLLEEFRGAIDKAISQGTTLQEFRKDFDAIVTRHGWNYKGNRGWRSKVIYDTNLRSAINAAREQQFTEPEFLKRHPYWMYRHSGAEHYRPEHKAWDGLVIRADDPWWETHSPQNGFGCRCSKFAVSERQLKKMGKAVPDTAPDNGTYEHVDKKSGEVHQLPKGIDYGWDYTPGRARLRSITPTALEQWPHVPTIPATRSFDPLPTPRPTPASRILPDNLNEQQYVDHFLKVFGATAATPHVFEDVVGERLPINDELFKNAKGQYKVKKHGRHPYIQLLADTIREPDEIWVVMEPRRTQPGKYLLARRYIARWEVEGSDIPALTVFTLGDRGWYGATTFTPQSSDYLQQQRLGVRLYRRTEKKE